MPWDGDVHTVSLVRQDGDLDCTVLLVPQDETWIIQYYLCSGWRLLQDGDIDCTVLLIAQDGDSFRMETSIVQYY